MAPSARKATIRNFNKGSIDLLITTDALSRGVDFSTNIRNNAPLVDNETLDIGGAQAIINYDAPLYVKTYVHRVGRTARAHREGSAYTILSRQECRFWKEIMRKNELYERISKLSESQLNTKAHECGWESVDSLANKYAAVIDELRTKLGKDDNNPYLIKL